MISVIKLPLWTTANKFLFIPIILCVLINLIVSLNVNPEIVRFAQKRCQNESTNSPLLRSFWELWEYPNDKQTHCYIKCFLYKIGLINITTRELDTPVIVDLLLYHGFKIKPAEQAWIEGPVDGTCKSYYNKWMSVKNVLGIKLRMALFALQADSTTYLNDYVISRPIQQTATKYCIKFAIEFIKNSNLSLMTTKFKSNFAKAFQCHLKCIYINFHYFDGYERIDPKEIMLSIREANQLSSVQRNSTKYKQLNEQEIIKNNVEKCSHRGNLYYMEGSCKIAYILHQCLTKEIPNYELIFKNRDQITYYY